MTLELFANNITSFIKIFNIILIGFCQILALIVITVGVIRALVIFVRDLLFKPQSTEAFQKSRLAMGYSFSLGLSFLVGASIVKTMNSSQWGDIARLAAIIGVRTLLNYLLLKAIPQEDSKPENNSVQNQTTQTV